MSSIPIGKIIGIRERYGAEFTAFGQAVDEAAAATACLSEVRDQAVLEDYLRDEVTARVAEPLKELRESSRR